MTCNYQKIEVCSVYHEGSNARYFSPLIAKATTAEGHHQGLFEEKERKGWDEKGKIENFCEFLDYMYYDQINKKQLVQIDGKIS